MKRIRVITPDGIDAALDATGSDELRASMELAKNKARIQTLVAGEPAQKLGIQPIFGTRSKTRFQELVDLYEKDKLHIHIRERFPLCKANAAAHRKVESGHGRGKGCSSNQLVFK